MLSKKALSKPYKLLETAWRKRRAVTFLAHLERLNSPAVCAVAKALMAVRQTSLATEELQIIERIEAFRAALKMDTTELALIYFDQDTPQIETIGSLPATDSDWGRFFFKLIRELKPSNVLEMGTSVGISAAYQAAALMLNKHGRLITLEGEQTVAELARKHLEQLELDRVEVRLGWFRDSLPATLNELKKLDIVYIDGHHQEHPTLEYFEQIFPFLTEEAVIIFDDIHWSGGMERAWRKILSDPRIGTALDLQKLGICFRADTREKSRRYSIYPFL
jgi:predicted O-methyltransferase YrrM